MTARPVAVPADQLALDLPGLPPLRVVDPAPRRPRRAVAPPVSTPLEAEPPTPAAAAGERVWLVWEDDEVLGVYADRDSAAADCAALRRAARRAPLPVRYECLPVPVFTGPRHDVPAAGATRPGTGRWRS